jgi:hypothetical protein
MIEAWLRHANQELLLGVMGGVSLMISDGLCRHLQFLGGVGSVEERVRGAVAVAGFRGLLSFGRHIFYPSTSWRKEEEGFPRRDESTMT